MPLARYAVFGASIAGLVVASSRLPSVWAYPFVLVTALLVGLGIHDLRQPLHSVRRNYPIVGRLRWFFEGIRPAIRQFLLEDEQAKVPFSRIQRSLVYARAKNESSEVAFGTLTDVYQNGYEFIAHSVRPVEPGDPATFRVPIGGADCTQPRARSMRGCLPRCSTMMRYAAVWPHGGSQFRQTHFSSARCTTPLRTM